MKSEVKQLEIIRDVEKNVFEIKLDGTPINGVQQYELKTLENGEPELKLVLNIQNVRVSIE